MTNNLALCDVKILSASAALFLEKGYNKTSVKHIAETAEADVGKVSECGGKERLLNDLIRNVFHCQNEVIREKLKPQTDDEALLCGAWLALLQHIAESNDVMRELFIAEFTIPTLAREIYSLLQERHNTAFAQYLPLTERADMYELEIAAVGIVRSYFTVACSTFFTMSHKVSRTIDAVFRIYHVPEEKIQETLEFVSELDFDGMAKETMQKVLEQYKIN